MIRARRKPARWWASWTAGMSVLVVLVVCHAARAEPLVPQNRRAAAQSKRGRSGPAAGLGHTIQPGESLWTISRRHGVSVEALRHANGLPPGQRLQIGQQLTIPGAAAEAQRQEPPSLAEIVLGTPPESRRIPFTWPVEGAVASPFGPRSGNWHGGVDLRAERGTPIRAAAPGMVIMSGSERAYGRVIKIWHVLDLMTVYAHNEENLVRVGEWVELGRVIATVGSSGRATAPHLHFEIRLDGRKYDPLFWLGAPGALDVATSNAGGPGPANTVR